MALTGIMRYEAKDSQGRQRVFVELPCQVCGTLFTRQERLLRNNSCSRRCSNVLDGTALKLACTACGETVFKSISKVPESGHVFCSRACKESEQKVGGLLALEHYGTSEVTYRAKAFKAYPHKCNACSYDNVLALEVHHKDRDRGNNKLSNLEILCCNCHTIEHKLNG